MLMLTLTDVLQLGVPDTNLVDSRHFGSFIEQQLHYLNVPHLSGFDQRSLSILRQEPGNTTSQLLLSQHLYDGKTQNTQILYQTGSPWCRSQCRGYTAECLSPWWRFLSPQPSTELSYCPADTRERHITD